MKELVWHRQYLPTIERNAGSTYVVETATGRSWTYGESGARVLRLADAPPAPPSPTERRRFRPGR